MSNINDLTIDDGLVLNQEAGMEFGIEDGVITDVI